jgi:predicted nucleic acid-binding protein
LTTVVVDASVVVRGCLEATGFEFIAGVDMVGPRLLPSEALSVLHELLWRGEISPVLAERALERLRGAPYKVQEPEGLTDAAWQVAESLGWAKTYDAEYVALAQILGHPLVTIDSRLARGAGRVVRIVGPGDLSTLG